MRDSKTVEVDWFQWTSLLHHINQEPFLSFFIIATSHNPRAEQSTLCPMYEHEDVSFEEQANLLA